MTGHDLKHMAKTHKKMTTGKNIWIVSKQPYNYQMSVLIGIYFQSFPNKKETSSELYTGIIYIKKAKLMSTYISLQIFIVSQIYANIFIDFLFLGKIFFQNIQKYNF